MLIFINSFKWEFFIFDQMTGIGKKCLKTDRKPLSYTMTFVMAKSGVKFRNIIDFCFVSIVCQLFSSYVC